MPTSEASYGKARTPEQRLIDIILAGLAEKYKRRQEDLDNKRWLSEKMRISRIKKE